jgi:putative SOS response-associated peptidase YedK
MAWSIVRTVPGKDPETGRPANWWFTIEGEEGCAFAGIGRFSEGARRFAFLTCEPNPLVAPLHPKAMPVILQREDYDAWLDGEAPDACSLAQPFPSQLMRVS